MKGLPRLAGNTIKVVKSVPLSIILLVCLCLLGLGIFRLFQNFLPPWDETALRVVHVYLADLNGDEHQDVYMVTNQIHRILFNDGNGNFTANRELSMHNYVLALGDLDGNDSLDALLTRFENGMMGGDLLFECAEVPADVVIPVGSEGQRCASATPILTLAPSLAQGPRPIHFSGKSVAACSQGHRRGSPDVSCATPRRVRGQDSCQPAQVLIMAIMLTILRLVHYYG